MPDKKIQLGENCFVHIRSGRPVKTTGLFSGKPLAGIDLDVLVPHESNMDTLEDVLKLGVVRVDDPFVDRAYQARLTQSYLTYQEGSPTRRYKIEVREVDEVPNVEELAIEGQRFLGT